MKYSLYFGLCFFVALFSCEKEEVSNFEDNVSELQGLSSDTFSLSVKNVIPEEIQTSSRSTLFLGAYQSDETGILSSSLFISLSPNNDNYNSTSNTTLDSLVLIMEFEDSYGEGDMDYDIYSTNNSVESSEIYFNHDSLDLNEKIGEFTFSGSGKIEVTLDQSFANDYFSNQNNSFEDSESYRTFLPGLAVIPRDFEGLNNEGQMLGITSEDIELVCYYKSSSQSFSATASLSNNTFGFFNVKNERSTSELQDYLDNGTPQNEYLFLQGLVGARIEIEFPYLEDWYKSGNFVVNRADLILPIKSHNNQAFKPLEAISFHVESENTFDGVQSVFIDDSTSYRINISGYVSDILSEEIDEKTFISALNPFARSGLSIVSAPNTPEKPLLLKLFYTQY